MANTAGIPQIGHDFDGYTVVEVLGEGRSGVALKVMRKVTGEYYAAKFLKSQDPVEQGRFLREGEALTTIGSHPNIVRIHHSGRFGVLPYLLLDFVDGEDLSQFEGVAFDFERATQLVIKIADALSHIHSFGILHRDLKPGNILIDPDGEPILTDFGTARLLDSVTLTQSQELLGTPYYMAPEQVTGQHEAVCEASDLWALAVVYYEMLVGFRPFESESLADLVSKILSSKIDSVGRYLNTEGLPAMPSYWAQDLEDFFDKALDREIAGRYQSADEFQRACQRLLDGEPLAAPKAKRFTTVLGVFVLLLMSVIVGMLWRQERQAQQASVRRLTDFKAAVTGYYLEPSEEDYKKGHRLRGYLTPDRDMKDPKLPKYLGLWSLVEARQRLQDGDLEEAQQHAQQAAKHLAHDNPQYLAYCGVEAARHNDPLTNAQVQALFKVLRKNAKNGLYQQVAAHEYFKLGRHGEAERAVQSAEALGFPCPRIKLQLAIAKDDYARALELAESLNLKLEAGERELIFSKLALKAFKVRNWSSLKRHVKQLKGVNEQSKALARIDKALVEEADEFNPRLQKIKIRGVMKAQDEVLLILQDLRRYRQVGAEIRPHWGLSRELRDNLGLLSLQLIRYIFIRPQVSMFLRTFSELLLEVDPEFTSSQALFLCIANRIGERTPALDRKVRASYSKFESMSGRSPQELVFGRGGYIAYLLSRGYFDEAQKLIQYELGPHGKIENDPYKAQLWYFNAVIEYRTLKRPELVLASLKRSVGLDAAFHAIRVYVHLLLERQGIDEAASSARAHLLRARRAHGFSEDNPPTKADVYCFLIRRFSPFSDAPIGLHLERLENDKRFQEIMRRIGPISRLRPGLRTNLGVSVARAGYREMGEGILKALHAELERQPEFKQKTIILKVLKDFIKRCLMPGDQLSGRTFMKLRSLVRAMDESFPKPLSDNSNKADRPDENEH